MSQSLANGAKLDAATFANFVERLHHDCVGAGVDDHCTSHAIFNVEQRVIVYGLDRDYSEKRVVFCDDSEWFSPKAFWDDLDSDSRAEVNKRMQDWSRCQFMKASESDQWEVLGELPNHTVTGWDDRWEIVNSHLTKDAAEAFIARKKHDYRKGLRVCVDSQYYAWEYEAIKKGVLSGRLRYVEPIPMPTFDGYREDIVRELQAAFSQAITNAGLVVSPVQQEAAA